MTLLIERKLTGRKVKMKLKLNESSIYRKAKMFNQMISIAIVFLLIILSFNHQLCDTHEWVDSTKLAQRSSSFNINNTRSKQTSKTQLWNLTVKSHTSIKPRHTRPSSIFVPIDGDDLNGRPMIGRPFPSIANPSDANHVQPKFLTSPDDHIVQTSSYQNEVYLPCKIINLPEDQTVSTSRTKQIHFSIYEHGSTQRTTSS